MRDVYVGGEFDVQELQILVVEDDHLIQSIVEDALKEGGFEIVIASSGEEALGLLDSADVKHRALVTDINLGREGLPRGMLK